MICDDRFRHFVEAAEQLADGRGSVEKVIAAAEAADDDPVDAYEATSNALRNAPVEAVAAADGAYHFGSTPEEVRAIQCDLIRDIVGNPFRPAHIDPTWLAYSDGTVVKLARSIYDERAFDRMPILADALEEAGCQDAEILAHCRGLGPHVRGCWLVDALAWRARGGPDGPPKSLSRR